MIKPIPTTYNGTRFRSRLEAKYAKAFDSYGVRWVYEVEGYHYGEIRYLPDFYLSTMNVLLEVKGPTIPGVEKPANLRKLLELGEVAKTDWWNPEVLILVGDTNGFVTLAGSNERAKLAKCRVCQGYFFLLETRSFECRLCRSYDGDHHLEKWIANLVLPQGVV